MTDVLMSNQTVKILLLLQIFMLTGAFHIGTTSTTTTRWTNKVMISQQSFSISIRPATILYEKKIKINDDVEGEILGPLADAKKLKDISTTDDEKDASSAASTGTVNERLLAELQQAADKEKYGARSAMAKKMGLDAFRSSKTDEEREAAIAEARDLNGVNPLVALTGSVVALAGAVGLWTLTNYLAEYFALHPVNENIYFIARVSQVFRNVIMGLVSLASGFFGVTGLGIFLLGVRVSYGVITGELDPTPIKKNKQQETDSNVDLGRVWDLMTNKSNKRGRR